MTMKINPKTGIDQLIFGMKQKDVTAIYGNPDKQYKDEENNVIFLYNDKKLRLTFYEDENLKLGYMISSNPDLELFSEKIIGKQVANFCDKNMIIPIQQHGFRQGGSCETALLSVTNQWLKHLDNGEVVGALLIDFSRATLYRTRSS